MVKYFVPIGTRVEGIRIYRLGVKADGNPSPN